MAQRSPLTAVPAQRSSLPLLKIRRRAVLIALLTAASLGVISTGAWLLDSDPAPVTAAQADTQAESLARLVAEDYLAGRDSRVPAAPSVVTKYASMTKPMEFTGLVLAGSRQYQLGDKASALIQVVKFTISPQDPAASLLTLSVPMLRTSTGWVLGAQPSLAPAATATTATDPSYDSLYTTGGDAGALGALSYGKNAVTQVQRWADAYASEGTSSKALFDLTGDKDGTHSYTGLGGWKAQDVRITSFMSGANSSDRAKRFGSVWVTVRVSLVLTSPAPNGPTLNTEYDLLLEPGANPASPPVTAWGPAGVGPTTALADFSNATTHG